MEAPKYKNLRTLLQWDREKAKEMILRLQEDAKQTVSDIEDEMIRLHGYKWKVRVSISFVVQGHNNCEDMARFSCCT
jgi:hypothetical protein